MGAEEVGALSEEGGSEGSHPVDKELSLPLPHVIFVMEAWLEGLLDAQIKRLFIALQFIFCECCAVDGLEVLIPVEHEMGGHCGPLPLMDKILEGIVILLRFILNFDLAHFLSEISYSLSLLFVLDLEALPNATLTLRVRGVIYRFSRSLGG